MTNLEELESISRILPGQTYSSKYKVIMDHNSWSTAFWRTYKGENRRTTVEYIELVIDTAIRNNVYPPLLKAATRGIINLQFTYKDDNGIFNKLDNILTRIDTYVTHRRFCDLEITSSYSDIQGRIPGENY